MNELEVKQYVEVKNNNVFTTSRMVAEKFGKEHKNVLRNVRQLIGKINGLNFAPVDYIDEKGELRQEYTINRKGYMLLAMRFTGDEAIKVQEAFIDAFDKMESYIKDAIVGLDLESKRLKSIPIAEPVFKTFKEVGLQFGLEKNQALLYANKATRRETGVDFQEILQIELKNEKQERYFTPTELGKRIGLSAQTFNQKLVSLGLQEKHGKDWVVLEKGKSLAVILDAGKKHSDGTPIQQIKWYESVLEFFKQDLSA